jgi:hypothetical protein|tara:strand:+ start:673 stop:1323 length:651 start_codon:yes stop_codon:yes gene_type:complete
MNFSNETLSILKNFSRINPSVVFRPGQTIRTISPQKTVMAAATVSETFDSSAGVYDVSRFLATLSLFDTPDVNFGKNQFDIKSGKRSLKYTYTAENMIVTPPERDIEIPEPEARVAISSADLEGVIRAAGVLGLPEIAFISEGSDISLAAVDSKNPTADNYSVVVSEGSGFEPFRMIIKVDNLNLMSADYDVALSSKGMAHFKSDKVQYWIAIESR